MLIEKVWKKVDVIQACVMHRETMMGDDPFQQQKVKIVTAYESRLTRQILASLVELSGLINPFVHLAKMAPIHEVAFQNLIALFEHVEDG